MGKVYKVVFLGLSEREDIFKKNISSLGVSCSAAEEMIEKAPVVLKENESLDFLKKYAAAITGAGGNVSIYTSPDNSGTSDKYRDIPTMASFTQCPQCGFRQLKEDKCVKCGLSLAGI